MAYNVKAALDAGYTEAEVADEIAKEKGFNVAAARQGGYSDWEILSELTKPEPGIVETGYRGFRRSLGELGVLAGDTLPALAASALLPEETARPIVEEQFRQAAETRADLERRFPTVYGSYKEVEDIGSGVGYVAEKFGELLPDILPSIATGGVGAFLGRKIATEAAEKAAKEAAQKAEFQLLEGGLDAATDAITYKNIADPIGRKAAEELTNIYARKGIGVGAFLGSYAQNAPEVFENVFEETGEIAPAGALLFGSLSSMLDAYLPAKLLGTFGDYGKSQIVAKMLQDSGADPAVWKAVLREGAKAAGMEGLTEAAQESISVAAEKFYGSNKDFFSPENVERYLESFFAGAAGGGALGGLSGIRQGMIEKAAAREQTAPPEAPPPPVDETTEVPPGEPPPGDVPVGGVPPTVLSGLPEGFDISKVDPTKVQSAQEFLDGFNAKTLQGSKLEINRQLQSVVRGLGIPLPKGMSRKTDDLLKVLNDALGQKPTTPPTETVAGTTPTETTPGVPPNLNSLSDEELEALILQKQEEQKFGREDTLYIGEDVLSALLAEKARRVQERAAPKEITQPELKEAMKPTFAPERIEELYERTRQDQDLPAWRKTGNQDSISKDEQLIFEDALSDFGRYLDEGESIQDVVDSAFQELKDYRKAKGEQRGKKAMAISSYEINRQAESNYRNVDLPRWNALPAPAKQAYLDKVKSPEEGTAGYRGPDYETQQAGFDAVQESLGVEATQEFQSERVAQGVLQRGEVESQRRVQAAEMDKRLGLNRPLPDDVAEAAKRGDLKAVLDYLEKDAQGKFIDPILRFGQRLTDAFDPITSRINRIVAGQLKALDLKTRLVYDETYNPVFGSAAEYDPSTDTIRIGPRGLQEVAILHEVTHAATVNVLYKFLNNRKGELTQQQRDGANRIINLYNITKKQLSGQFPFAYANPYEFVAYAMSDPKFQAELQKRKVPQDMIKFTDFPEVEDIDESISNAWTSFVRSIAQVLRLFRKVGKIFRISGLPKELFDQSRVRTAKDIQEDTELTAEEKLALIKEVDDREKNPEYRRLRSKLAKVTKIETGYIQRRNKLATSLVNEAKKGLKKEEADKISEFSPQIQNNPEYKKAVADVKRQRSNVQNALDQIEDAGFGEFITRETITEAKSGIASSEDPGYIGNMFLETAGAFSTILDAPPDGGIPLFSAKPLRIGAPAVKSAQEEATEVYDRLKNRLEGTAATSAGKIGQVVKGLFDRDKRSAYGNYLIQKLQNSKIAFKNLEDNLDKTKRLVTIGNLDEINNIDTVMSSATALSQNLYNFKIKVPRDEAAQLLKKIQDTKKLDEKETLALLHTYIIGLHDRERRHQKFLREVPLNATADAQRKTIYKKLASDSLIKKMANEQTRKQAEKEIDDLRADLEKIVADPKNRKLPNMAEPVNSENDNKYNALGYSHQVATEFLSRFNTDPNQADIDKLFKKLKEIQDITQDLNRDANYFNPAVEAVIRFYNWQNYFPFKGKPDPTNKNQVYDLTSERMGGDYAQGEMAFTGRQSDSDNPILQILTEATRSAMRAGHKEVPHAMKNLIRSGIVAGSKKPKTVKFEERYDVDFNIKDIKKEDAFFVYKDDGSIDIYEVHDPDMRRALKGVFKPETPVIDLANQVTSFFGQMHTRYNPAFGPLDFVRNLMTYSGLIGAKYGPKAGAQVMSAMSRVIAEGGMQKTLKFTNAYNRGDRKTLEKLGKTDPFYKDILEYYDLGGPVAYVQGLTANQNLEGLAQQVNARGVFGITKENFDNFFDAWIAMFESTSRIAAYRTVKDRLVKEGTPVEEAKVKAMAFAKDMANFQQVGDLGKTIGALYMFWRPAATGAVRAMRALAPGLDFRTDAQIKQFFKNQTKFGQITDAQADNAVREYNKERQNARLMSYSLLGAGFFVYMMAYMLAGDDEEERNKVAIDDMTRWVRFARFNTGIEVGGKDLVFQLPWGFGPGALASTGAQIASVAMGNQSLMDAANNIMDAGFESFMPLPISKIDKMENPTAWAVDSLAPSALRPLVEFAMNTDGLGRSIYSDRQSRYADAFLGGDNVPDIWKDAARGMFSLTGGGVDVSPGSMYFFANNYLDGLTRAIATTYNLGNVIAGKKDFDPRTDTLFLDSYFKAPSNYDAIQFTKAENRIKDMERKLKVLEGTPDYDTYVANNPMDQMAVDFYNETVNSDLRDLRAEANRVRRDPNMSPKERRDMLQLLTKQQNQIKSAFTTAMAGAYLGFEDLAYD
jgi:hypothetical protein